MRLDFWHCSGEMEALICCQTSEHSSGDGGGGLGTRLSSTGCTAYITIMVNYDYSLLSVEQHEKDSWR